MTFRDKLMIYLATKGDRLDMDYQQARANTSYRVADEVDYMECLVAKARRGMYNEVMTEIFNLLRGGKI